MVANVRSISAKRAERHASTRPSVAAVYGGGGMFGIAYALGVAEALVGAGAPLRTASSLGTSAGSWVAACLAADVPLDAVHDLPKVRVPNVRPGMLRGVAEQLFGRRTSPLVQASAVRLSTGRRLLLSGAEHRLAEIVAASSSVPGLFAPAAVGRRLYVDGGTRSMVSADLAADADHLLVVAPMAGPMFGPAGRSMELLLRREVRRWVARTGGTAHLIRPNRTIAALARNPFDLFDQQLARDIQPMAAGQTEALLRSRPDLQQLCTTAPATALPAVA
jgi:NTE family protein